MKQSYRFFENELCEFYPCHKGLKEINCLFCYCPMYFKEECLGTPVYKKVQGQLVKDCSQCEFPHDPEHYDLIMKALMKGCEEHE